MALSASSSVSRFASHGASSNAAIPSAPEVVPGEYEFSQPAEERRPGQLADAVRPDVIARQVEAAEVREVRAAGEFGDERLHRDEANVSQGREPRERSPRN